jgi:chorismate--pyruvate lyase
MLAWLLDPASLTKRLQAACSGQFSVQVLEQGWARPMQNESLALGVRRWNYGLVRQVKLLCDNQPWVFARTVIPRSTLTGKQRHLAYLGSKPLGAVLFADSNMKRGEVEIASIVPGQQLFDLATSDLKIKPEKIWGRRSVFYLSGKPLLVSEIFLPTIGNRSGGCGKGIMWKGKR